MKQINIYAGILCGLLISTNSSSQIITTFAGTGPGGYNGDGIPANTAQLNNPNSVNVLPSGTIIITDGYNQRIRTIDGAGIINTYVGNGTQGYADGPVGQAIVAEATGISYDQQGNLYFADFAGHRVRKITSGTVTTLAGTGTAGYGGDGGPGTSAQLNHPCGLWIDPQGNVYFTDRDNHRVRKIDLNGTITTVAGIGTGTYSGDGGPATSAGLNMPNKVAMDASGNLYIADAMNHRVRKVTPGGTISTFAGTGVAGYSGDGGPSTSAQVNRPMGLGIDAAGNIYIADFNNNRFRRVNANGIISTFAGTGTAGSAGDGGSPTSAQLSSPYGINFDNIGTAYIDDPGNNKIRKVTCVQPTVTTSSSRTLICAGETATLGVSGGDLYSWSNGATTATIQITPSVTTSYTVTITNSVTGCRNSTVMVQSVTDCTGIEEMANNTFELNIYPNPSDGKLMVSSNSETNFWLINSLGQTIKAEKLLKINNYETELNGISSGIYFLTTENGLKRKIIVLKNENK
jgi:sugar lactone lactonase YvrE